jgi:anthranilate phosphoribosyltransferase
MTIHQQNALFHGPAHQGGSLSYLNCIRDLVGGDQVVAGPDTDEARHLFSAMLDGGVPELELGGLLVALGVHPLDTAALLGFSDALSERVLKLQLPGSERRPVVIPAYGGALRQPNLTTLVALVLQRLGIPVLIHGTLESHGRIATAYVLREFGILPCTTLLQAQSALDRDKLAFVPTGVMAPGLAQLLALRGRIGNPRRRPRIELVLDGAAQLLFGEEAMHDASEAPDATPAELEPRATAAMIRTYLDGTAKLPLPIVNQLACCLYGSGYTSDFNEAKAIIAVEARSMAAA